MTFNGSPKQKAYEMLEVMNFNNDLKTYEFFEIEFNEKQISGRPPYRISESGGPERKCLACHQGGRPLWETYPHWPGFYGSSDDFPALQKNAYRDLTSMIPGLQPRLTREWNNFKKQHLTQGRYRFLQPLKSSLVDGPGSEPRPNADLGVGIFINNMKRITSLLTNAIPADPRQRSLLLYGMFCVNPNEWLDGADELRKMESEFKAKVEAKIRESNLYILRTELAGMGVPWTEMQKGITDYEKTNMVPPSPAAQNENEFYKNLNFDLGYFRVAGFSTEVYKPLFFSILEKVAPNARLEFWPTNLFRVYRFDNGFNIDLYFRKALLTSLYPNQNYGVDKELIEKLTDSQHSLHARSCADTLRASGYPSNFYDYATTKESQERTKRLLFIANLVQ
jgi:hypothetical protein